MFNLVYDDSFCPDLETVTLCNFWMVVLGNLGCIIVSFDLCNWGSSSTFIHLCLPWHVSPPVYMFFFLYSCFSCLCFLRPLKCRNPSTAFYQAFRPSRLRGSKPVNDRYELGCLLVCVCVCVACTGWLTQTLHPYYAANLTRICPC